MEWLFRLIDRLSGKQAQRQLQFDILVDQLRTENLNHQREFIRILKQNIQGWEELEKSKTDGKS